MAKIGFNTKAVEEQENDNVVKTDQIENYVHKIKLFGIPVWSSTKNHTVDIKTVEK